MQKQYYILFLFLFTLLLNTTTIAGHQQEPVKTDPVINRDTTIRPIFIIYSAVIKQDSVISRDTIIKPLIVNGRDTLIKPVFVIDTAIIKKDAAIKQDTISKPAMVTDPTAIAGRTDPAISRHTIITPIINVIDFTGIKTDPVINQDTIIKTITIIDSAASKTDTVTGRHTIITPVITVIDSTAIKTDPVTNQDTIITPINAIDAAVTKTDPAINQDAAIKPPILIDSTVTKTDPVISRQIINTPINAIDSAVIKTDPAINQDTVTKPIYIIYSAVIKQDSVISRDTIIKPITVIEPDFAINQGSISKTVNTTDPTAIKTDPVISQDIITQPAIVTDTPVSKPSSVISQHTITPINTIDPTGIKTNPLINQDTIIKAINAIGPSVIKTNPVVTVDKIIPPVLIIDTVIIKTDSFNLNKQPVYDPKLGFKNLFETAVTGNASNKAKLNPLAISFVQSFIAKNKKGMLAMKEWCGPYFNLMDGILMQHGVPKEMKYLAVIESGLKYNANSWTGAVGPWAFMPAAAQQYGLRMGRTFDERLDYYKSTHAAASLLTDLYAKYGDWLLVVAAYNGGPGSVDNAIRKSGGSKDFWVLQYHLPNESMNHVKKFIATHYIFEVEGGFTTVTKKEMKDLILNNNPNLIYTELSNSTTYKITGRFSSAVIIKHIDMDITTFLRYNPHFDNEIAVNGTYELRLPTQKMNIFIAKRYEILDESIQSLLKTTNNKSSNQ